jgi:hypothetical protein
MVTYGGMAKKPITLSTGPLIFKDLRLQGFWLGKWKSNHSDEEFSTMVNYLLRLVRDGKLQYAYVSHYFCCIQFVFLITSAVYNLSLIALMHELIWLSDIYRLQSPRGHRWKFSKSSLLMQVKNLTALFVHCTYQKPLYV